MVGGSPGALVGPVERHVERLAGATATCQSRMFKQSHPATTFRSRSPRSMLLWMVAACDARLLAADVVRPRPVFLSQLLDFIGTSQWRLRESSPNPESRIRIVLATIGRFMTGRVVRALLPRRADPPMGLPNPDSVVDHGHALIIIKRMWCTRRYSGVLKSGFHSLRPTMFRDRRRLRRWATQVLLVWLFGIATGMANACALRVAAHHHESASASAVHHETGMSHDHGRQSQDADEQVNCLDFCEKSSVAATSLKFTLDQGGDVQSFAILPSPSPGVAAWPVVASARGGGVRATRGGPPPRIAFQRLAL